MDLGRWLISLVLFIPFLLEAQPCVIEIEEDFHKTNLSSKISIYSTENKLDARQAYDSILLSQKSLLCTNITSSGFTKEFFWVSFSVKNYLKDTISLYLELDNPHIDTIGFYQINEESVRELGMAGDKMLFSERDIPNRRFIFNIRLNGFQSNTYILMLDKRTGAISYPLKLWRKDVFEKRETQATLIHFLYFGGLWFLALFSFAMGLLVKNKRIFLYGIYVALMGSYLFIALGYASQYVYPDSTTLNNLTRSQFMLLTLSSFVIFSIYYINLDKLAKVVFRILLSIAIFLILLSATSILFYPFFFKHVYFFLKLVYALILVFGPLIFFAIAKTYKENKRLNLAYLTAFAILLVGTALNIFIEFGWINEDLFIVNPILIASVFELFILSSSFIFEIKTIQNKKNQLLKQKAEIQKSLSDAYITGTEAEGSRISKELHDNIGSRLAILKNKIELQNFDRALLKNEVNTIFQDVKDISNQLSPNKLQILGFVDALESLFNELKLSTVMEVNFNVQSGIESFNDKVELQLYRVAQELIQNIIKHSKATVVDCQVLIENEKDLIIILDDNGVGFDSDIKDNKTYGNGLKNVMFRIESINSSIEISSTPGNGTHIVIWCRDYQEL